MTTSPRKQTPEIQRSPTPPSQKLIWGNRSRTRRNLLVHENVGFGLGIYSMYIIYCITYLEKHAQHIYSHYKSTNIALVGGWTVEPTHLKKYSSNWIMSPNRDEHKNVWNHHLVPHFVGRIPPPLQASNSPPRSPLPTEQTVWSGTQLCHASVWVFNQLQAVSLIQANKFESISRGKFHANS